MRRAFNKDLSGTRFERLIVIRLSDCHMEPRGEMVTRWLCKCDCGRESVVLRNSLVSGKTKSCGCLRLECSVQMGAANLRHGMSKSPEYKVWSCMRDRCSKPDHPNAKNYFARGLRVCERWQLFENFYADMGPRPGAGYSIERKNNDDGYSPANCKWTTRKEQASNTRVNRFIEYDGKRMCLKAWAEENGMSIQVLSYRLDQMWPMERALSQPVGKRSR